MNWDIYYLSIAHVVATRSKDPHTKHGAVITDEFNKPISFGYNGPPAGIDDKLVKYTRPEKYPYFIHAEMNAILFAKQSLNNARIYVTGYPCLDCLKHIAQSKIAKIIHTNRLSRSMKEGEYPIKFKKMCKLYQIELVEYNIQDVINQIKPVYNQAIEVCNGFCSPT